MYNPGLMSWGQFIRYLFTTGNLSVSKLTDFYHSDAMYPIGLNGASQAILDAEMLSTCLKEGVEDVPRALEKYQAARLPPTSRIIMANRGNGPDQVLQLAHERAPGGFENVYDVILKEELDEIGAQYKKIAGFEMEAVNTKAKQTEGTAEKLGLTSPAEWVYKEPRASI